jgi:polyferredoxin
MATSIALNAKPGVKRNFSKALLITQISVYLFIILHSITWHVFGIHALSKLCPFVFGDQVGNLEFNWVIVFWFLIFGSAIFLGRAFCAWGCMFGAYQDFVSRIATKLKAKPVDNKYRPWIIAAIGFVFVGIVVVLGSQENWPSVFWHVVIAVSAGLVIWILVEKKISGQNIIKLPKYIYVGQYLGGIVVAWIALNVFQRGIQLAFDKYGILDGENWAWQAATLVIIGVGIVTADKRIFCKYMCPIGMVFRLLSALPFPTKFKVRATDEKCTQCGKCSRSCLAGLNPMKDINTWGVVKDPNCVNCLECVSNCPQNAIGFSAK